MTNKILSLVIIIMLGISLYLQFKKPAQKATWTAEKQREYANKLKAEGLNREAIAEYEKYIEHADQKTQANIYYTMGKIAEETGEYEKALAYFYKVELVFPETDIKQELGEHIVACLEKMGRGLDAQLALEKRTSLKEKETAGSRVIARIGKEEITDIQLNKELEKLPEWMREEYKTEEKKTEFLKQFVAMELLYRKAKRLGYDKDTDIRQRLSDITRELMVQRLLEKEMGERINISSDQIELYYKANKDKYINEETRSETEIPTKVGAEESPFEEVRDRVSYDYQLEQQKVVYQELLEETLRAEDVEIY